MHTFEEETPPSSINGDEISSMEEDGVIYLDDMEEYDLDEFLEQVEGLEVHDEETETEKPEDNANLVFTKHNSSVFTCDLHPDGKIAVTGGEDDKAFVWSVDDGRILMECTGHKDSVIFVGFSFDGAYVATADMSGIIKVWKCNTENHDPWVLTFEYEADDLVFGLWHFGARVLICGAASGDIYVFKIPTGDTKVLQGHNTKVECGKLFGDGVRLVAGYEDGAVKVWDLKTSTVVQQVPSSVHEMRVTDIDIHPENNLMASISTDGKVVLTTSINGKIIGQLETENDLETVAFSKDPTLGYFALGTLNGSVTIWDVARQMIRNHCSKPEVDHGSGVTKMMWVKDNLVTGCLDGSIRIYEGRSGERQAMLTGHWSEVLDLCCNQKENIILTCADDGARIFKCELNKVNG